MTNCYLCNQELIGESISVEHILPESIGGKLTSKELLCTTCNKTTGHLYDAEFTKLGGFLANKYLINQAKGSATFQASEIGTGKKIKVTPGFKISYVDPISRYDKEMIGVQHLDKKRAVEELRRISKLLGDRPINSDEIFFETVDPPTNNQIDFLYDRQIEPALLLRSVCKTIINLYLFKTGDYDNSQPVINFLKEDINNLFCWFLDLEISKKFHKKSPYHIVIIKAEKKSKLLYAYFEMFGEVGFLALINGQYRGEDQQINYTFDPINSIEVNYDYDFKLKAGDIIDHLRVKPESETVKCIHY